MEDNTDNEKNSERKDKEKDDFKQNEVVQLLMNKDKNSSLHKFNIPRRKPFKLTEPKFFDPLDTSASSFNSVLLRKLNKLGSEENFSVQATRQHVDSLSSTDSDFNIRSDVVQFASNVATEVRNTKGCETFKTKPHTLSSQSVEQPSTSNVVEPRIKNQKATCSTQIDFERAVPSSSSTTHTMADLYDCSSVHHAYENYLKNEAHYVNSGINIIAEQTDSTSTTPEELAKVKFLPKNFTIIPRSIGEDRLIKPESSHLSHYQNPTINTNIAEPPRPEQDQNAVEKYLAEKSNFIIDSIREVTETTNLDVFTCYLQCLEGSLIIEEVLKKEDINVIKYIKMPNFANLVNSISTINSRIAYDDRFKSVSTNLYITLFKIIEAISTNKLYQMLFETITKPTLDFMIDILSQNIDKELNLLLLDIFYVICKIEHNCEFISSKKFYDSLLASIVLSYKFIPVISKILNRIIKCESLLKCSTHQDDIINLLLEFLNCSYNFPEGRLKVAQLLNKIATTKSAMKTLLLQHNYMKLSDYVSQNAGNNEFNGRVLVYSILNRLQNTVVLSKPEKYTEFNIPEYILLCVDTNNLYLREEAIESEDSDDSTTYAAKDTHESATQISRKMSSKSMTIMQDYYKEYFTCEFDKILPIPLRIYSIYSGHLSSDIIIQRVKRFRNLAGIALPDHLMLEADNDNYTYFPSRINWNNLLGKQQNNPDGTPRFTPRIVYDLDKLNSTSDKVELIRLESFKPESATRIDDSLKFESRFECGNLQKVTQVGIQEYDLELSPDTLTSSDGLLWFYFRVSNLHGGRYVFNIINIKKSCKTTTDQMMPYMFSAMDYKKDKTGWRRAGLNVIFYGNRYTNETRNIQYKTLSFTMSFPYIEDYCYIARYVPYTYSRLMCILSPCIAPETSNVYTRIDYLCSTVNNSNEVPVLTITSQVKHPKYLSIPLHKRPVVFLLARVHPGDANSSWLMEGMIRFLLNKCNEIAALARRYYVFKIVPMLNPEGVIYGNTKCDLIGQDLNKCWSNPHCNLCPEIHYTKKLVEFATNHDNIPIAAFIDIQGHTDKDFLFFYGCNPTMSWNRVDHAKGDIKDILEMLPKTIEKINRNLKLSQCKYDIPKSKEHTARVVMWRELGIMQSYTLHCSYSRGHKEQSMNPKRLVKIGQSIIASLAHIADVTYNFQDTLPNFGLDYNS